MATQQINLNEIPISALSQNSRQILSQGLNTPKVILTPAGIPRDYRGVLHRLKLKTLNVNQLVMILDPMDMVLSHWMNEEGTAASIGGLLKFLTEIDRYDVHDDVTASCRK